MLLGMDKSGKKPSKKVREGGRMLAFVKYFVLIVMVVVIIFPLFFVFMSSVKSDDEIFLNPFGWPENPLFDNYKIVMVDMQMWRYMLNSFYYGFASVAVILLCAVTAGYAIARMRWKLSGAALGLLMTGMLIPMHAVILPLYLSVRRIGVKSPWIVLVLIFAAFGLPKSVFIMVNFLKGIPKSIEEAAVIDGAGLFKIITTIIIPLLAPAISVCAIFDFLTVWNDLLISLIFINDRNQRTLQLGIMMFKGDYTTNYGSLMTAVCCAVIPTIILYIFFQKKIVSGLTSGAVKG